MQTLFPHRISDFLKATRRGRWQRGIYSAAAVRCQRSGGMNSAPPKNLSWAISGPLTLPSRLERRGPASCPIRRQRDRALTESLPRGTLAELNGAHYVPSSRLRDQHALLAA